MVFLEAWRGRRNIELVHDSALPWLYGIAGNTVRQQTRTALWHRRLLAKPPREDIEPDPDDVGLNWDPP